MMLALSLPLSLASEAPLSLASEARLSPRVLAHRHSPLSRLSLSSLSLGAGTDGLVDGADGLGGEDIVKL
jgi:hypothetical protein